MVTWEYRTERWDSTERWDNEEGVSAGDVMAAELDSIGAEGWEMVNFVWGAGAIRAVFKRPVKKAGRW